MDITAKNIHLQYKGYIKTPVLWNGLGPLGLRQLELPNSASALPLLDIPKKVRLGKLVERFVVAQLRQDTKTKVLLENVQIRHNKITLGELDCVFTDNKKVVHLEIIYKFYLYDATVGSTAIEHWIGPNRRDSLIKKLRKLKDKQLPLLFNQHTQDTLNEAQVSLSDTEQQVCFKAQLFLPYNNKFIDFGTLNSVCVKGFYISFTEIDSLNDCGFYIPEKLDWLIEPHPLVDWISLVDYKRTLTPIIDQKMAPLCWLKRPDRRLEKFFVVWWD